MHVVIAKTTPSGRFEPHLLNLQQLSHTLLLNVTADFVHSRLYQSHLSLVSKNLQCRQQDHLRVRRGSALCAFHYHVHYLWCVCVCVPSFSVQDAATFSPRTQETPDLPNCCKKLSSLDRPLLSSSQKRQKPVVCRKVRFEMLRSDGPSARVFEGIK